MAQVNVQIAGRQYRMACDDGQEAHLQALAARLDIKITELRGHFGEIGDQRMTVMAALTMADDLSEAEGQIAALRAELATHRRSDSESERRLVRLSDTVATAIGEAARRIERVARSLDGTARD